MQRVVPAVPAIVTLAASFLFAGCQGSTATNPNRQESDQAAQPSILGRWTTSTSPDMAESRTSMAFLESGEFQYNSPLVLFGKPVTGKVDGKDVAARLIGSGTWYLSGDRLRVRITQTNQPSVTFEEPLDYKVIENTEKKLVLENQDSELTALFKEPAATK